MGIAHKEESVLKDSDISPGGRKIVKVRGVEIGVFNIDGTYKAVANWCPHEGGPVCTGYLTGTVGLDRPRGWVPKWIREGEILCCPWHGYEFDIRTGQCITRKELRLRTYSVKKNDDGALAVDL